jgi:hypothetical protein
MLPSPVPADPGWDEDLAWLDRDPEREDWLARAREHDESPGEDEDYENFEPFTPEELAEIQEAAADELLAAGAASTGRRGPGRPGSTRVFPGESASRAAAFGPGMPLDMLPGCAGLASTSTSHGGGHRHRAAATSACPAPRRRADDRTASHVICVRGAARSRTPPRTRPPASRIHSAVPRLMFRRTVDSKSGIGPNNGSTSRASSSPDATSSGVPALTVLTRTSWPAI